MARTGTPFTLGEHKASNSTMQYGTEQTILRHPFKGVLCKDQSTSEGAYSTQAQGQRQVELTVSNTCPEV